VHLGIVLLRRELDFATARALCLEEFTKTEGGTVTCLPGRTEEIDAESVDDEAEGPFSRSHLEGIGS
jgi:hypothetical protein